MRSPIFLAASTAMLLGGSLVSAIDLDIESKDSIKSVASTIAYDMMTYYHGNESGGIPGVLPGPPPDPPDGYYWWEGGAMWGALIDYWHFTGDSTYNDLAETGIQFQTGDNNDMMPTNWSSSMGNDDQGFWGMTALTAAETNFQNPPSGRPSWLALAQAVFNTQATRQDTDCNGGLRWQVYPYLSGYDYKNSIANGCFFNIAARLARYTENSTYADTAEEIWDWTKGVGLISDDYKIYDGAHIGTNCTDINPIQFSYNMGVYLMGAASLYNYTNGSDVWKQRVTSLLNSTLDTFFPDGIAYEAACEEHLSCSIDELSFKSFVTRWLAQTSQLAPFTRDTIMPVLKTSAIAAAKQCSGGSDGRTCGLSWSKGTDWDGTKGVGQQMAAMSVVFTNMLQFSDEESNISGPLTNSSGGTSTGDPNAGSQSKDPIAIAPATTGDRAGAGILTTLMLVTATGFFCWISI